MNPEIDGAPRMSFYDAVRFNMPLVFDALSEPQRRTIRALSWAPVEIAHKRTGRFRVEPRTAYRIVDMGLASVQEMDERRWLVATQLPFVVGRLLEIFAPFDRRTQERMMTYTEGVVA